MNDSVTWIIPVAPAPEAGERETNRPLASGGVRLGILDNAKGNADHLLRMITEGVSTRLPIASVVSLRKPGPASGATQEVLDQLAAETDFVVSAMAD